jgi:hypothetical protein
LLRARASELSQLLKKRKGKSYSERTIQEGQNL